METKIQRWGNSLGLRIPKSFAAEARVEAGSTVDISVENGELRIRPLVRPAYDLGELLNRVTESNRHGAAEWGEPEGREAW